MNEFESDLRKQLATEAEHVQGLPRDLSAHIADASGPRPALWLRLAPVAVAVVFVGALGLLLRQPGHLQAPTNGPAAVASPSAPASAAPGPSTAPVPSASPVAGVGPFVCGAGGSGGTPGMPINLNLIAIRVAHQAGFDRITFEFGGGGIPAYAITPQAGTRFYQDASGMPVDVKGIQGLKVVFHGSSERDVNGNTTYTGSNDILLAPASGSGSAVAEVRQVGDFERVLSWAVGVSSKPACTRVLELTAPSRLVIDVQQQP
jgi:hypothetical protein